MDFRVRLRPARDIPCRYDNATRKTGQTEIEMFGLLKKTGSTPPAQTPATQADDDSTGMADGCPVDHGAMTGGAADAAAPARKKDSRVVEVGWIIDTDKAGFIWSEPKQLKRITSYNKHAKSVAVCPGVLDYDARMFEVPSPIDVQLRIRIDDKGNPQLINVNADRATIRSKHLGQMVAVMPRKEWRDPDKPIIQLITPYLFVADDVAWMSQMPPFNHYNPRPWPGVMIGGRLPVHIWPRHMMWAFEWHDIKQDLFLKRGDPLFYARFETQDPTRPVRMVEAVKTPELAEFLKGLSGVTNYVNRTFSLFQVAQERRPAKLLTRKTG